MAILKSTHSSIITVGFAAALVMLATVAALSYVSIDRLREDARSVAHTHDVISEVEALQSRIRDAESAQRGYLITGDERDLESYHAAGATLPHLLSSLRAMAADNMRQRVSLERLENLIPERLRLLERGIRDKRDGNLAGDEQTARGSGRQVMSEIGAAVEAMKIEEHTLLLERSAQSSASAERTVRSIAAGNAAAFAALIAAFWLLRREVAQRLALQQAAQAYAAEVADLYNQAPCGYHSVDKDGVFVRINDTWLQWLGYTRDEVLGKMKHSDIMTAESAEYFRREAFPLFRQQGWLKNVEFSYVRKDGSIMPAFLNATSVCDADGNYLMSRSAVYDIAYRKRAEEKIRHLNEDLERRAAQLEISNKELEGFSCSVSHDLRSPLRAVDGYSQILEEDYAAQLDDEGRRLLAVIRDSSRKMGALIDDLLAFSRLGRKPINAVETDMNTLVREVLQEIRTGHDGKEPQISIANLPPARVDRALLKQVWINLLSNALKFSGKHERPLIEIGWNGRGAETVYSVSDNGAGFDMKYYNKLFGVFQRLHGNEEFEGTGVGLPIVQRVVTRHGGRVWAEGEINAGATFYFALPRGDAIGQYDAG